MYQISVVELSSMGIRCIINPILVLYYVKLARRIVKQKYDFVELKPKKKNVYEKESNFKYFLITLEGDIVVLCIKI